MAKQDDFVRITLRLPAELHAALVASVGAGSLNAEIVSRLERSFDPADEPDDLKRLDGKLQHLLVLMEGLRQSQAMLEEQATQLADIATSEQNLRIEAERQLKEALKDK